MIHCSGQCQTTWHIFSTTYCLPTSGSETSQNFMTLPVREVRTLGGQLPIESVKLTCIYKTLGKHSGRLEK